MAAAKGNQYAAKERIWAAAINRALDRRSKSRKDKIAEIDALADTLLDKALDGDMQAIKEFGDRMEGKPKQMIEASGPDGGPMMFSQIKRTVVDPRK